MSFYKGRTRKIILGIVIFFTLYTGFGFLALPAILRSVGAKKLSEATLRQATINKIEFNPYAFTLHVFDIKIMDHDGEKFFSLEEIFVNFEPLSCIAKLAIVFDEVRFANPYFRVKLDEKGVFNFSDLVRKAGEKPPEPEQPKKDESGDDYLNILIRKLVLIGGSMAYTDLSMDRTFTTDLRETKIEINDLTVERGKESAFNINTGTESGERVSLEGAVTLNPLSVKGRIELAGIVLKKYTPYFYERTNFDLNDGIFNLKCSYLYQSREEGDVMVIDDGLVELRSLSMADRNNGSEFLNIPLFQLSGAKVDVTNGKVSLKHILTESGSLRVDVSEAGEVNLARLFAMNAPEAKPGKQPEEEEKKPQKQPGKSEETDAWTVTLGKFEMNKYSVVVEDHSPGETATIKLDDLLFETGDITFPPKGSPYGFDISMLINETAELGIHALLNIKPLDLGMDIDLSGLALKDFQPYVAGSTNLVISNGAFNTSGRLELSVPDSGGPTVKYDGRMSIDNFSSRAKGSTADLLKWRKLDLPTIVAGYNPLVVNIDTVALTDLYTDLVIFANGKTNLEAAFVKTGQREESPAKSEGGNTPEESAQGGGSPVTLKTLKLENASVNFTDNTIDPVYETSMSGITGKVTGIVDDSTPLMGIYLNGKFNRYSKISFAGKIHKTNYRDYMNLDIDFQNVNLTPLTPYSSKYLGYKLAKGILSLKLKYLIQRRQLEASNKIYFDRLTLGDKVQSEDAPNLPLRLAISLLTDRNGIIDLDIPITGDLSNPKVGIWKIIGQALKNLITKLASAPFAAIGAVLEGDEDISYVAFEPGTSDITAGQMKKMDVLIDALYSRPGVGLEITGDADPDLDSAALKKIILEGMIMELKKKGLEHDGKLPENLEEIEIKPRERERYIKELYGATDFSVPWGDVLLLKPQAVKEFLAGAINIDKLARKIKRLYSKSEGTSEEEDQGEGEKKLTVEEMEKKLLDHIKITDRELILLARERAANVQAYIMDSEKITPDRVFIVEPKLESEGEEDGKDRNRVVFGLR